MRYSAREAREGVVSDGVKVGGFARDHQSQTARDGRGYPARKGGRDTAAVWGGKRVRCDESDVGRAEGWLVLWAGFQDIYYIYIYYGQLVSFCNTFVLHNLLAPEPVCNTPA